MTKGIHMQALNIVVVGSGMYVTGRGTDGFGTIMPAIFEWKRSRPLGSVSLVSTAPASVRHAKAKMRELSKRMGVGLPIRYYPEGAKIDADAYKKAFRNVPRPACAFICVPDHVHTSIALDAINEGLHTFVVKPLAPTTREVLMLADARKRANVHGAVDFHKRWDDANIKMRGVIAEGRIGDPLYIIVEYSQKKSVPGKHFKRWVERTNIFQYLGVHYVDLIHYATGALPKRLMATAQKSFLRAKGINTYDAVQAVIEWRMPSGNKFVSHIMTNWIDPESMSAMSEQRIKVIGTKGRFESDQKRRGIFIVSDEHGIEEPNPYFSSSYGQAGGMAYRGYGIQSIHQFLEDCRRIHAREISPDSIHGDRPTFEQSLIPAAVIEAVGKSLENGNKWSEVRL